MSYQYHEYKCPYYSWDKPLETGCEKGCKVKFPDKESARQYRNRYCWNIDSWGHCTLARMLNEFFERTEEG